jgi:hypothetical protein
MSPQTFKITMNKLDVIKNGDSPGKSELYYTLMVDDQIIDALDENQARKTGDGDTIILGRSSLVTKSASASLTVLGTVSDNDGFLKGADDTDSFREVYTAANNFGVGPHMARLRSGNGHLDVIVHYSIARA